MRDAPLPCFNAAGRAVGLFIIVMTPYRRRSKGQPARRHRSLERPACARWRSLFEAAPIAMLVVDDAQIVAAANAQAERLFGYAAGLLAGRPIGQLFHSGRAPVVALDAGPVRAFTAQRADGTSLRVEFATQAVRSNGKPCIVGAIFDNSARQVAEDERRSRADRELEQSEERYHALAEALPQIVWTADVNGSLDYYNGRWFEYTGMTLEQTRGWGWKPVLHPDDLESCIAAWSYSVAHGTPYEIEYRFKRAGDQTYRWHLGRALPIRNPDGTIRKWFGTCTDIDDFKRSLEAQQRLTEQLHFIVEATDRIANSTSERDALQTICQLITPRFADWVEIDYLEADGRIRNVALEHASPDKAAAVAAIRGQYSIDPGVNDAIANVFATGRPAIAGEPRDAPAGDKLGMRSQICVPLIVRARTVAVLAAHWAQSEREFSAIDIPFFEQLAKRAALAFDEAIRHDRARANEELTRQILESSEDCIAILDTAGRLVSMNAYGRARFDVAGFALAPGADWFDCWQAEDRDAARAALVAATHGAPGKYEGRLLGGEGNQQWWDVVVTPVYDVSGNPGQLLAIARDVTAQKQHETVLQQSEARYRSMADAMPQIAFTAGSDGNLDFVNARWVEYTGLSLAMSSQQRIALVMHPDDGARVIDSWRTAMRSGADYETECRIRSASDGHYRWHLMRAIPLRDESGRVRRWFGAATDIDDQKRALTEIANARDEALNAAMVKSRFLATMSHEIRTPMSGVIGMTELLMLTSLNDEQREYAKIVRDSGQALLRVINDILDFSKIESGKLGLEPAPFAVREQILSVVDLLQSQFSEKTIALDYAVDPLVPAMLVGDPGRLRQILMNLVGNALKFTPPGGRVRIDVVSVRANASGSTVKFSVTDNGIGIAPDAQGRLFEPFSQADESTSRRFGGTGLGLSICKELVALMDGTIGVESALGAGATFWCVIPLGTVATSVAPSDPVREIRVRGERRAKSRGRREKILLVEDNAVNVLLANRQFAQLGFTISTAGNGREAIEALAQAEFDLIFMDCHMPEMDGFEATRRIRESEASSGTHSCIVAMTADAQVEDRRACLAAGMDDYLAKPSSIASLAAVLERWLPEPEPQPAA